MANVINYSWDFSKEEFSLDLDFFNEKEQEDKLWQARTGFNFETLCGAIETIIFMSDRPVKIQTIKSQIDNDLPLRVIHQSLTRLQDEFEMKHHGIRLMEVAQGYQFRTKATYSKLVQNIFKVSSIQLSPTALEVLAIIAYKQPISKSAVESIRGVDSSHVVRQLMDKRLLRICGRSEELGKPVAYGTTAEFLEVFNLADIDDLPSEVELTELASASDVASINQIKSIVNHGEKKRFDLDEFEELESLSLSINEIESDTMFTRSLKDMDKARKTQDGEVKLSAFDLLEVYVNNAQVIEQNKEALSSETIMSAMEPKSIDISADKLFNTPVLSEEDLGALRELPKASLTEEEAIDEAEIKLAEATADETNASFEAAIDQLLDEAFEPEYVTEAKIEIEEVLEAGFVSENIEIEQVLDAEFIPENTQVVHVSNVSNLAEEAKELEQALDMAFDNLAFDDEPAADSKDSTSPDELDGFDSIESILAKTIDEIESENNQKS